MGLSNIEDILQAGLDGETLPTPESRIAELLKEWIEQGGNIDDILVAGSNITLTKNPDGTITIAASGEVSSEDTVARAEIVAIKDGETLDSFGDVETALGDKADTSTTYTKTEVDTALEGKADTTDIPTIPITAIQKNGTGITPVSGTVNITVPTQASDINAATAAQGSKADTAIQGIKVNSSTVNPDSNKVVSITVPTSAADVSALPNTTKYAAALSLTINSSTFVMTGQLKDQNGDNLGTAQTIDLPLESVVVGGSYNSQTKKVVLTLQNGNTIEFSVADLVSGLQTELSASNKLNPAYINYDSTHRAVSDTEKSTWNGKQNAIDSSHQLSADLVDDTNATNKFATAAELEQISTNKNNISTLQTSLAVGSSDNAKVLTAIYEGGEGSYAWVTPSGGGGTSDYTDLTNKPQVNGITLNGNKSLANLGIAAAEDIPTLVSGLNTTGTVKNGSSVTSATGYTPSPIISGIPYYKDTTYESKSAASGGTAVSLCTTGEKYIWNNKQSALTTAQLSAVNSGIDSTKVAQIATNEANILTIEKSQGQKNIVNIADSSGTTWIDITVSLSAGNYALYFGNITTNAIGTTCQIATLDGGTIKQYFRIGRGDNVSMPFVLTDSITTIRLYAGEDYAGSNGKDVSFTDIMVCDKTYYDGGLMDYQPYTMTLSDITSWILTHS